MRVVGIHICEALFSSGGDFKRMTRTTPLRHPARCCLVKDEPGLSDRHRFPLLVVVWGERRREQDATKSECTKPKPPQRVLLVLQLLHCEILMTQQDAGVLHLSQPTA